MSRHGMSINDADVRALQQLFRALDRGGDPSVLLRSDEVRRFRAALSRIERGERLRFGGQLREVKGG